MVSIFTLVSIGINHPFARCLRLPMKAFNMRKFEWKICSLTLCVFVHSFNKHWRSHLTIEIVSNFRRSHSPAHSKKSPPYSILEGASAVSSGANLLRKFERVFFDEKNLFILRSRLHILFCPSQISHQWLVVSVAINIVVGVCCFVSVYDLLLAACH